MSKNPFITNDKEIVADSGVSGEVAKNLHYLCDRIGTRFAGTAGYRRAADFMLDTFKSYGLDNVRLEPFEFLAWRRGKPAELSMVTPESYAIPCHVLPYSGWTEDAAAEAEIVDIGSGAEDEVEAKKNEMKGRFVVTTSASRHRTDVYKQCAAFGAVGFILTGKVPTLLPTGSVADAEDVSIPAVSISLEDALRIERITATETVTFSLTVDAALETDTTWNVIGELTGTECPDELVIMGGHLDSHDIAPCAFDNAAGAMHVMETARLLSTQRKHLKRTVRFIGFAGEEIGLLGSHHHAAANAEELQNAWFMLNSDCPSTGSPHGLAFHRWDAGEAYMPVFGEQMGRPVQSSQRFHCHSDHYPFMLQGVPTGAVTSSQSRSTGGGYVHTAGDTIDKLCLADLQDSACFAARLLLRIASDSAWPRERLPQDQVDELQANR